MKTSKTELAQKISVTLPLIEEITDIQCIPICLIGAKQTGEKIIYFHFATIDDKPETEELLYKACQLIVDKLKDKYPNENPV